MKQKPKTKTPRKLRLGGIRNTKKTARFQKFAEQLARDFQ
jgi:hypothetical protein